MGGEAEAPPLIHRWEGPVLQEELEDRVLFVAGVKLRALLSVNNGCISELDPQP